jgi:SAM-dependent methyltransferase
MITNGTTMAFRDRYLAPCLLTPFAEDMARRLSRISMGPMLELAADCGALTQAIAAAVSAGLTVIATDQNAEAVAYASTKPGMARIVWQQVDPAALPFQDATFGIVACHFGIPSLLDRVAAFVDVRRVMKPGGRFVFSVPAHLRHNPVADCLQDTMEDLFPADPPRFVGDVLHGYADTQAIDDNLTEAGFTDAIYTSVDLPYTAASAHDVALGYCLGTKLRLEIEARAPDGVEGVLASVTAALQRRFGKGAVEANMRAHIISAAG